MSLETNVKTIHDLNALWPPISDPRAQGADHLRNIKTALLGTFPNLTTCPMTDAQSNAILALVGDGSGSDKMTVIQKATGDLDYAPLSGGVQKSSGSMWFNYKDTDGTTKFAFSQPAGDYVTNALGDGKYIRSPENGSIDNRITFMGQNKANKGIFLRIADGSVVQLQPSGSYVTWDQMNTDIVVATQFHFHANGYSEVYRQDSDPNSGVIDYYSNYRGTNYNVARITSDGSYRTLAGGSIFLDDPAANDGTNGNYNGSPFVNFAMSSRGAVATMRFEESIGRTHQLTFHINGFGSDTYYWMDGPSGRLASSKGGGFAFQSEIPTDYVTHGELQNSLPFVDKGLRAQVFTRVAGNGVTVTLPQAFRTLVSVFAQQFSSGSEGIRPVRIETDGLNGGQFRMSEWAEGGNTQYSFLVFGYF